jgi:zona occludens toxin (predicted ATPase)
MHKTNCFLPRSFTSILAAFLLVAGAPAATASSPAAAKPADAATAKPAIRINAGASAAHTDESGVAWLPDQGFADGEVTDRAPDLPIAKTKTPSLYRTEHYGMSAFSYKVANGKYVVKLHFAETYEDITGPGQRVFSFNVEGHAVKDFDVFAKAGGAQKAYVETVNVEVTDGKLDITFTSNIQEPEINAIEIIPAA